MRTDHVAISSVHSSLTWAVNWWNSHMDRNWCSSERVNDMVLLASFLASGLTLSLPHQFPSMHLCIISQLKLVNCELLKWPYRQTIFLTTIWFTFNSNRTCLIELEKHNILGWFGGYSGRAALILGVHHWWLHQNKLFLQWLKGEWASKYLPVIVDPHFMWSIWHKSKMNLGLWSWPWL